MKQGIAEFVKRLSSRKFLLTLATCGLLYHAKAYDTIIYIVIGYLASEGSADALTAYQSGKATVASIQQQTDLITSGVVAAPNSAAEPDRPIVPGQ